MFHFIVDCFSGAGRGGTLRGEEGEGAMYSMMDSKWRYYRLLETPIRFKERKNKEIDSGGLLKLFHGHLILLFKENYLDWIHMLKIQWSKFNYLKTQEVRKKKSDSQKMTTKSSRTSFERYWKMKAGMLHFNLKQFVALVQ